MTTQATQDISDLPNVFSGPSAWRGDHMRTQTDWMHELAPSEITELENAAEHYLQLGHDIGRINAELFPLPQLSEKLKNLKHTLLKGNGFKVIRGLPTEQYEQQFSAAIFCGIGSHLGKARSQNAAGHILGHVRDIGADASDPNSRIYQTNARQTFHTDSADVVGLLCLNAAKSGGDSMLVSVETIFNVMQEQCPELLLKLFDPIATDRRGEIPAGEQPFMSIPVLNWYQQKLTVFYQRQYINSAQRFENAPPLTATHTEALNSFDELANDPQLHLNMTLEPGDMQFVYNHSQLHDRTAFMDWPDKKQRRHLMRLWLSVEGDRPLPDYFKQRYGSITIGDRGGIITDKTHLHAPID